MSNLHKDLTDAQIHVPKGFAAAANDTTLTKDGSGNLVWAAGGGGGGVTSIIAGSGISVDAATGDVTVTNIQNHYMAQNIQAYGDITGTDEWALSSAQYNSEHKFALSLGAYPVTTVTPKQMVQGAVWNNGVSAALKRWNGWVYGGAGTEVVFNLLRTIIPCPPPAEYPTTVDVLRTASTTVTLTGNTTPACFDVAVFTGEPVNLVTNEIIILTAHVAEGTEAVEFVTNQNITLAGA